MNEHDLQKAQRCFTVTDRVNMTPANTQSVDKWWRAYAYQEQIETFFVKELPGEIKDAETAAAYLRLTKPELADMAEPHLLLSDVSFLLRHRHRLGRKPTPYIQTSTPK